MSRESIRIPDVYADGRWRRADELSDLAAGWLSTILDAFGDRLPLLGMVLPALPEGVALYAALTSLFTPSVVLSPDPKAWAGTSLPLDTPVMLLPAFAHLADDVKSVGGQPFLLPVSSRPTHAVLAPLTSPVLVTFTSGSTGSPKPVHKVMARVMAGVTARSEAVGLKPGDGIIGGVTLAHGQGLNALVAAMMLGGPFGFLPLVNHRAALAMLAMPQFRCWRATPHYADLLSGCQLTGPAIVPDLCLLASPIAVRVFEAFGERFGVPLRQVYSSSEAGQVAVDGRPASEVRPGSVGEPLPGVEVSIGDQPGASDSSPGRIWIRSPYMMGGYGFPPNVQPLDTIDGWLPTRDVGTIRADRQIVLAGRLDDCIRSRDGRLVNLAAIAAMIRDIDGVRAVVVVPLEGPSGSSFGAVIECHLSPPPVHVREKMSDALPVWARPRKMAFVEELPKLPNGKPDRQTCMVTLTGLTS